jgi:hypothetical protein
MIKKAPEEALAKKESYLFQLDMIRRAISVGNGSHEGVHVHHALFDFYSAIVVRRDVGNERPGIRARPEHRA